MGSFVNYTSTSSVYIHCVGMCVCQYSMFNYISCFIKCGTNSSDFTILFYSSKTKMKSGYFLIEYDSLIMFGGLIMFV